MLILDVQLDAGTDASEFARKVCLLAPHVDEVRVDTTGPGFVFAERLESMQVDVTKYNRAAGK